MDLPVPAEPVISRLEPRKYPLPSIASSRSTPLDTRACEVSGATVVALISATSIPKAPMTSGASFSAKLEPRYLITWTYLKAI